MSLHEPHSVIKRWIPSISVHNFTIHFKWWLKNKDSEALSRFIYEYRKDNEVHEDKSSI